MANGRLTLKEIPEKERPREKLLHAGEEAVSDAELIAIVLGAGTRDESAIQIAQRILTRAGDLQTLSEMSLAELCEFKGIGTARAAQLKAALELARRYTLRLQSSRAQFSNSQREFDHLQFYFRGKQQEEFWVVSLDAKNRLLSQARI
jgi:DNA repair protein RadC